MILAIYIYICRISRFSSSQRIIVAIFDYLHIDYISNQSLLIDDSISNRKQILYLAEENRKNTTCFGLML